jgi:hypothetical protein
MTILNWEKAYYATGVTPENNWLAIYKKYLYTVNRIRMSPTPTLNLTKINKNLITALFT